MENGIKQRIEEIFATYYQLLCFRAERIVGNKEAAKDVVNDVFLKLWERHELLPLTKSLLVYVHQSIRNNSLNYLKHKKIMHKYVQNVNNELHLHPPYDENNPLSVLIADETMTEIEQAIEALPNNCKKVFLLQLDGFSYQEITKKLGISINTVKKQISIAMEKLRKLLIKPENEKKFQSFSPELHL